MKQDKAILKALKSQETPSLSTGFNSRMMNLVYLAAEKKKKQAYILSLCLISTVSLGLISLGIYMLKDYLSENFTLQLPTMNILSESIAKYMFSIYVAFLIFILIGLDTVFRSVWHKRKDHKSRQFN